MKKLLIVIGIVFGSIFYANTEMLSDSKTNYASEETEKLWDKYINNGSVDTIGYHFVILDGQLIPGVYNHFFDGHIETGRALDDDPFIETNEVGAHVSGYNLNSVGICCIGKSGNITDNQMNAAVKLVYMLEEQFREIRLHQHSDFAATTKPHCAGLNMGKFLDNYHINKSMA